MTRYQLDKAQYQCEWFTKWIRKTLGQQRMTAEQFAKLVGVSLTTVMTWLNGVRSPGLKTFLMILDKLGWEMTITEKR